MKISVLINNYNYASFIEECLDSVMHQTLQAYEIIVVDDGSTDNSLEKIANHRLNVICIAQENRGQLEAMAKGTNESSGDLLCYLDSDDTWHPDYLKTISEAFDSYEKPDFVYMNLRRFGAESGLLPPQFKKDTLIPSSQQILQTRNIYLGSPTSANSIRAEIAKKIFSNLSPSRIESYRICADEVLVFGASIYGCRKLFLSAHLVNYRVHSKNSHYNKLDGSEWKKPAQIKRTLLISKLSDQVGVEFNIKNLQQEFTAQIKRSTENSLLLKAYFKAPKRLHLSLAFRLYWFIKNKILITLQKNYNTSTR
jgi:glycosyltransferase involved in cell wall biosynthesis